MRETDERIRDLLGPVRLERPGAALRDWPDAPLSVIDLDTVEALSAAAGVPVDPGRFRANLRLSGLGAWNELELPGQRVRLGAAELEFSSPPSAAVPPPSAPERGCAT